VVDALIDLEVTTQDRDIDGFQITFSLGKNLKKSFKEYSLLENGILDPPNRIIIVVTIGVKKYVLIDGIITNHQVLPSNQPGASRLIITGEDISLQLDLKDKSAIYPDQSDSTIVSSLLNAYKQYGIVPKVTATNFVPPKEEIITTQQGTDLTFIERLAERNSFVFYIQPSNTPGENIIAYWGEEEQKVESTQPALTMNMGSYTNVDSPITFSYDALEPTDPQVRRLDEANRKAISATVGKSANPQQAKKPAKPIRQTVVRYSAKLDATQANRLAKTVSDESTQDALTATGELHTIRYGHVLQVRQLVDLRGVGYSYDGNYYVKKVTHHIKHGQYTQNFTLIREGRETTKTKVDKV
jgi:phage protein D